MDIISTAVLALAPVVLASSGPPASSRAYYRAGVAARSSDDRQALHDAGVAMARRLLVERPDDPEGLLWLAANLGAGSLARGKLAALRALPEMERTLLRLDQVAPAYEHAAASRVLGRLYDKAPMIISIGSSARARRWFERALALAPSFAGNQALAAEFFADEGEPARAVELATRVLATPPEALAAEPDAPEWREIARKVVERGGR